MTPEELHSRILLHELRTILLDETREGDQLPEERKQILRDDPHSTAPYLILADWLEDQGSELGELCRIQVELAGTPFSMYARFAHELPPVCLDAALVEASNPLRPLLIRKAGIWRNLYPPKEFFFSKESLSPIPPAKLNPYIKRVLKEEGFDLTRHWDAPSPFGPGNYTQSRRLGRTTRMLTDVLRYCCLNQGKIVRVSHNQPATTCVTLSELAVELIDHEGFERDYVGNPTYPVILNDNRIYFSDNYPWGHGPRLDITFTDHACQQQEAYRQIADRMTRDLEDRLARELYGNLSERDHQAFTTFWQGDFLRD